MTLNGIPSAAMLSMETVWLDASRYHEAEKQYNEYQSRSNISRLQTSGSTNVCSAAPVSSLVTEIAQARQKLQNFLKSGEVDTSANDNLWSRVQTLENEKAVLNKRLALVEQRLEEVLQKVLKLDPLSSNAAADSLKFFSMDGDALKKCIRTVDNALTDSLSGVPNFKTVLEGKGVSTQVCKAFEGEKQKAMSKIIKVLDETMATCCQIYSSSKENSGQNIKNGPTDDDDDVDLFASDEETEEEKRVKEERVKAYSEKKSKKPALVAKSSVLLDVKPWDDETDMKSMEVAVRKIALDGLKWGASKLVPLAYGIKKLQILAVVEDEKVSIDALTEQIEEINDMVQSVDIAAFNKL